MIEIVLNVLRNRPTWSDSDAFTMIQARLGLWLAVWVAIPAAPPIVDAALPTTRWLANRSVCAVVNRVCLCDSRSHSRKNGRCTQRGTCESSRRGECTPHSFF